MDLPHRTDEGCETQTHFPQGEVIIHAFRRWQMHRNTGGVYLTYLLFTELHSARRAGILTQFHFEQLLYRPEKYLLYYMPIRTASLILS